MKSNQVHSFGHVPAANIKRSSFNRSCGWKGTIDAGYLYPVFVDEVIPGDTFNLRENLFGRLNTPLRPIMDNIFLDTHYFFVPNRLLWSNWEKFNGAQDNPGDSTDYTVPQIAPTTGASGFVENELFDYMGVPPAVANQENINNFHGRAYNLIWNEWFRDENLQDSVTVDLDDGPDAEADYVLLKRGKRRDYFTSCLPWPQKGTEVTLPLGATAPIATDSTSADAVLVQFNARTGDPFKRLDASGGSLLAYSGNSVETGSELYADLSAATAASINDIREAFQLQRMLEKDARGGSRYQEIIMSHFNVMALDSRLQRPEFLGGSSTYVNVNPVANTSSTATENQGDLAGIGTVSNQGKGFIQSFHEHGVIIGLASVRADLNYQQGLDRMWTRSDRYDFYWPSLAGLGEQAVLNKEIYLQGTSADDDVFGYAPRYEEYRFKNSVITSKFRSSYATALDDWHLAQEFGSLPVLGDTFIQENPPMDRVVAVTTEPDFILDCYFQLNTVRPMPTYGVPGMIDHF